MDFPSLFEDLSVGRRGYAKVIDGRVTQEKRDGPVGTIIRCSIESPRTHGFELSVVVEVPKSNGVEMHLDAAYEHPTCDDIGDRRGSRPTRQVVSACRRSDESLVAAVFSPGRAESQKLVSSNHDPQSG